MLGLRRFNSTQVDLWQGDANTFACDLMLQDRDLLQKEDATWALKHICILCSDNSDAQKIMASIKARLQIKSGPAANPRRITVIAPSIVVYDTLQEALFSTFKDD